MPEVQFIFPLVFRLQHHSTQLPPATAGFIEAPPAKGVSVGDILQVPEEL